MSLREDYKNDMFEGLREYRMVENANGTVSLEDVTNYEQIGDIFNADDINITNKAVNDTVRGFEEVRTETEKFQQNMNQNFNNLQTNVNSSVAAIKTVKTATLSASGWSSSSPYMQTVAVPGIEAADAPIIALYLSGSPTAATVKAQKKAFGYLDRAVTGAGNITFYCYEKKPASNFAVSIKGE